MATIKAYTDIEQSRKLAEILPLESADMMYQEYETVIGDDYGYVYKIQPFSDPNIDGVSCWSLAALLGVIPQEIFDGEYIINITEGLDNRWILTYDSFKNRYRSFYGLSSSADNLVDACYEMIIKLNELKML